MSITVVAPTAIEPPTTEPPAPPPAPVSFEDYLAWCGATDVRAEWVNGEIAVMSPNSTEHQDLLDFLNDLVKTYVRAHQLGKVYFAPLLMRLPNRPSGREPDLLFIATEHLGRLKATYLDGPADLAVEIVSPESVARDRGEKFVEYEAGEVREYWIVDSLRQEALFYQLGPDRLYHPGVLDREGVYHSAVLAGFRLRVDWLWQRPLPLLSEVTSEIGI